MSLVRTAMAIMIALSIAGAAAADPPKRDERVMVIAEPGTARELAQVSEDLRALGYHVVVVEEGFSDAKPPATASYRASGSVRLRADGKKIEIWIAADDKARPELRQVIEPADDTAAAHGDAAVHAVEVLRAALIEIRAQQRPWAPPVPQPSSEPVRTPPAVVKMAPAHHAALGLSAGIGRVPVPGQSSGWEVPIRLHAFPEDRWSFEFRAAIPLSTGTLQGPEGTGRFKVTHLGIDGWFSPSRWPAGPYVGIGVSLMRLSMTAEARPGFEARDQTLLSAVPHVGMGVFWKLGDRFRLRLNGAVGMGMPPIEVRFAGRSVDTWNKVVLTSDVSIEAVVF